MKKKKAVVISGEVNRRWLGEGGRRGSARGRIRETVAPKNHTGVKFCFSFFINDSGHYHEYLHFDF